MKLILFVLFALASSVHSAKVSPAIYASLVKSPSINIFLSFDNTLISATLRSMTSEFDLAKTPRASRANAVHAMLKEHAEKSQRDTLEFLGRLKSVTYRSFWISNQIYVQGVDRDTILLLEALPEVVEITEEITVHLDDTLESVQLGLVRSPKVQEWGVKKIRAPEAWNITSGRVGEGVIVGSIDTGARATHEALRENYLNSETSWFDAYNKNPEPFDDNGHGSHVTGTICGKNGIGVAPGAQWMACKAFTSGGSGSQPAILACGQFYACPHHPDGSPAPDCSGVPHLVSNSWGSGASGLTWFNEVIKAWRAAGIIPVFSAGNSGPNCNTVRSPGDNKDVIAAGATVVDDTIASFSSVGPSFEGGQKPDVSAPGSSVRSAYYTSDIAYATMSGTSMACPHVSGLVALMQSVKELSYQDVKDIIEGTSSPDTTSGGKTCANVPDHEFPNYHFGHGRIDALDAIKILATKY